MERKYIVFVDNDHLDLTAQGQCPREKLVLMTYLSYRCNEWCTIFRTKASSGGHEKCDLICVYVLFHLKWWHDNSNSRFNWILLKLTDTIFYFLIHSKSWQVYKRNANQLLEGLRKEFPGIESVVNPTKPRSKSFEFTLKKRMVQVCEQHV